MSLPALGNPHSDIGIIKANRLSVRKGPGRKQPLIKILVKGERVIVIKNLGRWLQVDCGELQGYIRNRSRYVQIISDSDKLPQSTAEPPEKSSQQDQILNDKTADQQFDETTTITDDDLDDDSDEDDDAQMIQRKIEDHQTEINELIADEAKSINKLYELELSLNNMRGRVAAIRRDIKAVSALIKDITTQIETVNTTIHSNEQYTAQRLSALYKLHRLGTMHVLASSKTINDFFRRKQAIETILAYDEHFLNQQLENKRRLLRLRDQHLQKKKEKEVLESELEVQLKSLSNEQKKRTQMLAAIRNKKSLTLAAIESLKQAAAALDQTILSLNVVDNKGLKDDTKKKFSDYKGLLKMPVRGKIVANFGSYRNTKFNLVNFRSGIEISADRGEPIRAVLSGQVLYARWFKGYGNMVIIDHGGNYYTVYAHAEELFKKRGDRVGTEEVIATVGDSASTVGTSLYFEVRHHGTPMDPLEWLKNS